MSNRTVFTEAKPRRNPPALQLFRRRGLLQNTAGRVIIYSITGNGGSGAASKRNGAVKTALNIYVAASLFALLILFYWVISEFFTMLFRFIGLPEEKARFQVTSLLTGCGFTTRESEMIISTQKRRLLARITMLFGYVFNITVVSAFINVFLSLKVSQLGGYIAGVLIPLAAAALIIIPLRIPAVRSRIDRALGKLAGSILHRGDGNTVMIIDHIGGGAIAQVELRIVPDFIKDKELSETGLKEDKNILVMLVEHVDGKAEAPTGKTVFTEHDKLTVFGDYKNICKVFDAQERFD